MINLFSKVEEDILTGQNIEVPSEDWIIGKHSPVSAFNTQKAETEQR